MMKQVVIILGFYFWRSNWSYRWCLEVMTYKPLTIGIVAALVALITLMELAYYLKVIQ